MLRLFQSFSQLCVYFHNYAIVKCYIVVIIHSPIIFSSPKNAWNVNEIRSKIHFWLEWIIILYREFSQYLSLGFSSLFYDSSVPKLRTPITSHACTVFLKFVYLNYYVNYLLGRCEGHGVSLHGIVTVVCAMISLNLCQNINVLSLGHVTQ